MQGYQCDFNEEENIASVIQTVLFVLWSDIDECSTQKGLCRNGQCLNTVGSFTCQCNVGYELSVDGRLCTGTKLELSIFLIFLSVICTVCFTWCPSYIPFSSDINECAERPGTCGAGTCVNLNGSYSCICPPGYYLHEDTCKGTAA